MTEKICDRTVKLEMPLEEPSPKLDDLLSSGKRFKKLKLRFELP